jgi:conjugal transfer ATP-binding protein TraC
MSSRLADCLQIWGLEGDFVIFSDGSLGFGLEATPVDISCWENGRVNDLVERAGQFLNGLPPHIDLQFMQEIGSGNEGIVASHSELMVDGASGTARAVCDERIARLRNLDEKGLLPKHTLKLFIRKPFSGALLDKPKLFSKNHLFPEIASKRLENEITLATRLREDTVQGLRSLGLEVQSIAPTAILDLIYRQWNPGRPVELGEFDPEDIRSSLLFTDVNISEKGFSLGNMHHRVISLKLMPDQTFAGMASALRQLPFDSRLFVSVHVADQFKEIASLQTQRRLAFAMVTGKTSGVSDIESQAKLEDLETLLEQMIAQGEKVFHVSVNVLLRSTDLEELETQVATTLMKFRELGGAEAMEESLAAFDIFAGFALPNAKTSERTRRVKTSNLSDLLPLYGPWSGHKRPSILLRSRMGSLVAFDPFSSELTNYNQIVSGGSGSGKSFLTNILMLHMLKENPRVFIVDIGGSYKKLCDNLDGQYIPMGVDFGICVNPFDLLPGETVPSSPKIKFLVGLVEIMTREDGESRLPKLERAELEEAIQKVYESERNPRLSHLREILLKNDSVEIRRLGRILTPWCGDTPYGRFVDRATNIQFERPIVAVDLKGMESYPDLQAVSLFIITDFVWREVQKDRMNKKFLVFDECWKLLENDAGASFIAEVFRTFRKYYAGAIAISQNLDDFAKSKVAGAILTNSSIKWILMQKGADQKRIQEVLQLNENEMGLIASLYQERGLYSEAFIMAQDDRAVVAIESTPLEYWIATTDPRDLGKIEEEMKLAPEKKPLEVLRTLSEKYPIGVAAAGGSK